MSLDELAVIAGVGRFHFLRSFKAEIGMTPHRYVTEPRIERAKRQLGGADLSLAQIAHALGFSSPAQSGSAFRQITGTTPGAFLRQRI